MPTWRLLTLDTCCVVGLANPSPTHDAVETLALERIVDAARDGRVDLQLAVAYDRDFSRWRDEDGRATRLAWLASAPLLPRASGIVRYGVSMLDSDDDLIGTDEEGELDEALRDLLLPGQTGPPDESDAEWLGKLTSDVDHLMAHARSGADAFVTTDEKTILSQMRRASLAALGITVCRPTEAVERLPIR